MIDAVTRCLIRAVSGDDAARIASIYAPYVLEQQSSYEYEAPSADTIYQRIIDTQNHHLPWLVAVAGDAIIGYSYATPYRARKGYQYVVEDAVYIDKDHTGHGIGKLLLDALIAHCAALGKRQMIAVIGDAQNNFASIRLHQRCGFEQIGLFRGIGYKHGRWLDNLMMQRSLGEGCTTLPE